MDTTMMNNQAQMAAAQQPWQFDLKSAMIGGGVATAISTLLSVGFRIREARKLAKAMEQAQNIVDDIDSFNEVN